MTQLGYSSLCSVLLDLLLKPILTLSLTRQGQSHFTIGALYFLRFLPASKPILTQLPLQKEFLKSLFRITIRYSSYAVQKYFYNLLKKCFRGKCEKKKQKQKANKQTKPHKKTQWLQQQQTTKNKNIFSWFWWHQHVTFLQRSLIPDSYTTSAGHREYYRVGLRHQFGVLFFQKFPIPPLPNHSNSGLLNLSRCFRLIYCNRICILFFLLYFFFKK